MCIKSVKILPEQTARIHIGLLSDGRLSIIPADDLAAFAARASAGIILSLDGYRCEYESACCLGKMYLGLLGRGLL